MLFRARLASHWLGVTMVNFDLRIVPLHSGISLGIRTMSAASQPAFTVVAIGAMAGEPPHIVKSEEHRFLACHARDGQIIEIKPGMEIVEMDDIRLLIGRGFQDFPASQKICIIRQQLESRLEERPLCKGHGSKYRRGVFVQDRIRHQQI